jgi:hypothetical protein
VQFLIEEALIARMDVHDRRAQREADELAAVANAERRVHDTIARMQGRLH